MPENTPAPTPQPTPAPPNYYDGEVYIPTYLEELLDDTSVFLNGAVLDYVDGLLQVKSVNGSFQNESIWSDSDIVKAVKYSSVKNADDFSTFVGEDDNTDYNKYLETISSNIYNTLEVFTEYAYGVEYMINLVYEELKNSLSPEEYNNLLNYIVNNKNINSLEAFTENHNVAQYIGVAAGRAGTIFGASMGTTFGAAAWAAYKSGGLSAVLALNNRELFTKAINNFINGTTPTLTGKTPTVGGRLISGLAIAGVLFALGVGYDVITGNFSWENTAIRGAKALVGVGASFVGTAVTAALSGTAAGSWAGPIGMAVGAVVAVIGNLIVDAIVHNIHYTSNDMPREYTTISVSDIKIQMEKQGYDTRTRMIGNSTYYEAISKIIYNTKSQDFMSYLLQNSGGGDFLPQDLQLSRSQLERYDRIMEILIARPDISDSVIAKRVGTLSSEELAFISDFKRIFRENPQYYNDFRDYFSKGMNQRPVARPTPPPLELDMPEETPAPTPPPSPQPCPAPDYNANGS